MGSVEDAMAASPGPVECPPVPTDEPEPEQDKELVAKLSEEGEFGNLPNDDQTDSLADVRDEIDGPLQEPGTSPDPPQGEQDQQSNGELADGSSEQDPEAAIPTEGDEVEMPGQESLENGGQAAERELSNESPVEAVPKDMHSIVEPEEDQTNDQAAADGESSSSEKSPAVVTDEDTSTDGLEKSRSFRDDLLALGTDFDESMACRDVMTALVGEANAAALEFCEEWARKLLQMPIIGHQSTLELGNETPVLVLSAASLMIDVRPSESIDVPCFAEARAILSWAVDGTLSLEITASVVDGAPLALTKTLDTAFRTMTLEAAMEILGLQDHEVLDLSTIIDSVRSLEQGPIDAAGALSPAISSLKALELQPRPAEVQLRYSFNGDQDLLVHSIHCSCNFTTAGESGGARIPITGADFALHTCEVRYERSAPGYLRLKAPGTVSNLQGSAVSFVLETCHDDLGRPSARIQLVDAHSLSDIAGIAQLHNIEQGVHEAFPGAHTGKAIDLEDVHLWLDSSPGTEEGIRVARMVATVRSSELEFASLLPSSIQRSQIAGGPKVSIEILHPHSAADRTITVIAEFGISVLEGAVPTKTHITAILAPGESRYKYHMRVEDSGGSLSLTNLADCFGLHDGRRFLEIEAACLSNALDSVHVNSVEGMMEQQGEALDIRSWTANFSIHALTLVPDLMCLEQIRLRVESKDDQTTLRASGIVLLGPLPKPIRIPVSLPQLGRSTILRFEENPELTIERLATAVGIPLSGIPALPIARDILGSPLHVAQATVENDGEHSILAALSMEVRQDAIKFGPLSLSECHHLLTYNRPALGASDSATHLWQTSASFAKSRTKATITHSGLSGQELALSIQPRDTATVVDVLDEILPSPIPAGIAGLLKKFPFSSADVQLDPENGSLRGGAIQIVESSVFRLGPASIRSPRLVCDPEVQPLNQALVEGNRDVHGEKAVHPQSPGHARLAFKGIVSNNETEANVSISIPLGGEPARDTLAISVHPLDGRQLPLSAILSLLGINSKQLQLLANDLNFLAKSVEGHIGYAQLDSQDGPPSLILDDLTIVGEAAEPATLIKDLNLKFDLFKFEGHYRRGTELVGAIQARLALGANTLWATLSVSDGCQVYTGEMDAGDLSLEDLARTFGLSAATAAPKFLDLKTPPLVSKVRVKHTSGQLLEVFVTGSSATEVSCSGLALPLADLGAYFRFSPGGSQGPPVSEGYLTASLCVPGFLAAQVRLRLSEEEAVLTAVLQAAHGATGNGLELIADVLGKGSNLAWSRVMPTSGKPMAFDHSGVAMRADFVASKIVALGVVDGVGKAVLITKALPGRENGCYISLAVKDLGAIWPASFQGLQAFTTTNLSLEVLTYDTTARDLQGELRQLAREVDLEHENSGAVLPLALLPPTTPLTPGAWFFGSVVLEGPSEMAKALSLAMDPSCKPTVTVYGRITPDGNDTVYSMDLRNFALLGGKITLDGTGTFTPANKVLTIDATLTLAGLTDQPLSLDVLLSVAPGETKFVTKDPAPRNLLPASGSSQPAPEKLIGNLFQGKMFNVEFAAPKFRGSSVKQGGKIMHTQVLEGAIKLGDAPVDPSLLGSVVFSLGKPQVASLSFAQPVSVEEMYRKIITPKSQKQATWPKWFPALQLDQARLYYAPGKEKLLLDGFDYLPGYHIQAQVTLLDRVFMLTADLPDSRSGIVLSGAHSGEIDLGFAQIKSPRMALDTTAAKPTFSIEAGLSLFGMDNTTLSLQYEMGGGESPSNSFSGLAKYKGSLFGIKDPSIPFKFANGNFGLSGWPVSHSGDGIFDLANSIMQASVADKTCSCGDLKGLKLDGVKTQFNFAVSMAHDKSAASSGLGLTAAAHLSLDVLVAKKKAASLALGDITLSIAPPFKKDQLLAALKSAVKDSAARVGQTMLQQPDEFAKVIALIAAKKLGKQVTQRLLCRKVRPKNLVQHAADLADAEAAAAEAGSFSALSLIRAVPLPIPIPGIPFLPGPKTLVAFAAASAALEAAALPIAVVGAAGGLASMLLGLPLAGISLVGLGRRRDKAKEQHEAAEASLAKTRRAIEDSLVLQGEAVARFEGDDRVVVDWAACLPRDGKKADLDGLTWTVRLTLADDVDGTPLQEAKMAASGACHWEQRSPAFAHEAKVHVWIRASAVARAHELTASRWTPAGPASHVPLLRPPTSVALSVAQADTSTVEVSTAGATRRCEVQIVGQGSGATEEEILWSRVNDSATGMVEVKAADLAQQRYPITSVLARVRNLSEDAKVSRHSPWAGSDAVYANSAPLDLVVSGSGQTVTAEWKPGSLESTSFLTEIYAADGGQVPVVGKETLSSDAMRQRAELVLGSRHSGEELVLHVYPAQVPGALSLRAKTTFTLVTPPTTANPPPLTCPTTSPTKSPVISSTELPRSMPVSATVSPVGSPVVEAGEILAIEPAASAVTEVRLVGATRDEGLNEQGKKPEVAVSVVPRLVGAARDEGRNEQGKKAGVAVSVAPIVSLPVIYNCSFASGATGPWKIEDGGSPVRLVKPGLDGKGGYKLCVTVDATAANRWAVAGSSTVWISQRLGVEVGRTYRISVAGRFVGVDHEQGYCNVFVDGLNVLSQQSTGDAAEAAWVRSVDYAAGWERPLLEVSVAATWSTRVEFELGAVEAELVD